MNDTRTQQAIEDAHLLGQETPWEAAVRGPLPGASGYAAHAVDAQSSVDEVLGYHVAEPDRSPKRPDFERTTYKPRKVEFNEILELWAAHEGGRLLRVLHVPGKDDQVIGEDDARRAWEWVEQTPGWSPIVREVMRHLELRKRTWAEWPKTHPVCGDWVGFIDLENDHKESRYFREFCPWPFITLEKAGEAWRPFYRWLRVRYRREPFYIHTQTVEYA